MRYTKDYGGTALRKITVVIPAYNEEAGIGNTLKELCGAIPDNYGIIVVDDGSGDNTYAIASNIDRSRIKVLRHDMNRGYGAAIKTACRHAEGEIIVWYDADGQHRPEDLMAVADKLIEEDLDYVIGARTQDSFVDKGRRMGKKLLSWFANKMAREPMADVNSGLRAFKREIILHHLGIMPDRFGASTVTSFIMQEMGYLGGVCPIIVRQRKGTSTVKPLKDGIETLKLIVNITLLFRARQTFSWIAALLFAAGVAYGVAKAFTAGLGIPVLAAVLILTAMQLYFMGIISAQITWLRLGNLDDRGENNGKK